MVRVRIELGSTRAKPYQGPRYEHWDANHYLLNLSMRTELASILRSLENRGRVVNDGC